MSVEPLGPVEALSEAHDLDQFDSGSQELDQWLRHSARVAVAAGTAATYVVCRGQQVIGYYALAMSSIGQDRAPSRLRRGMPDPVPVVLLARLALDRTEQGRHLGGHLLVDALRRCVRGGREFGARAVVVDAISEEAAEFYRHFDFHDLDERRLWRRLGDIENALRFGRRNRRARPEAMVIVAPAAVLGALLFIHRDGRRDRSPTLDVPGALLIGGGMFMLVFGLSEGSTYGWSFVGALVAILIPGTSSLLAHGPPVVIEIGDEAAPTGAVLAPDATR